MSLFQTSVRISLSSPILPTSPTPSSAPTSSPTLSELIISTPSYLRDLKLTPSLFSATTPAETTTPSSSSSSGLSPAIGGVLGGAIVLAVMLVAILTAWKMVYAAFGRAAAKKWQAEATILAERTQSRTVSRCSRLLLFRRKRRLC